jgi:hypothetical protein
MHDRLQLLDEAELEERRVELLVRDRRSDFSP